MSKQLNTAIIISFQLEGFHKWDQAPNEVDFLRERHRHMFHFKVEKEVAHDDRDIEIILFKRKVETYLIKKYGRRHESSIAWWLELDSQSCEMLAREILEHFDCVRVEVLEDGENGAVIWK